MARCRFAGPGLGFPLGHPLDTTSESKKSTAEPPGRAEDGVASAYRSRHAERPRESMNIDENCAICSEFHLFSSTFPWFSSIHCIKSIHLSMRHHVLGKIAAQCGHAVLGAYHMAREAGEWLVGVVGASNLQAKRLRSLQESSQTMVKRLFTPIDYRNRSSDHKYIHKPLLGPYRTIIYAKKPCEHQTIPLFRPTQERSGAMKIALKISSEELNRC